MKRTTVLFIYCISIALLMAYLDEAFEINNAVFWFFAAATMTIWSIIDRYFDEKQL